jgi:hypothetical protein
VTLDDIARNYDPTGHPDVISGHETADAHFKHFLSFFRMFGAAKPSDAVSKDSFLQLYRAFSASLPEDKAFAALIKAEWRI